MYGFLTKLTSPCLLPNQGQKSVTMIESLRLDGVWMDRLQVCRTVRGRSLHLRPDGLPRDEEVAHLIAFDGVERIAASILFQSNWSGRAEIGLTRSDDSLLKTLPDGETFAQTVLARPGDGYYGIGT